MSADAAVGIIQRALIIALMLAAPMLLFGLVAGLIISIVQAVTQIQEMTLTFIPKMVAICFAIIIFGQWMLLTLMRFTREIFELIPQAVR